jgi:hypothetical protein
VWSRFMDGAAALARLTMPAPLVCRFFELDHM